MPVSGYEEPGFKPHGWHSSDSIAGVPIKKRRLPFILPQSPPPETQSSQAVEPVQTEKEHFNLKEGSSPKADDAREASGTSGTPRSYSQEEKGKSSADSNVDLVQSKVRLPGFVIGEPTCSTPLGSGAERSDKQETKVADRPVSPKIPENIAPELAQKGAVVGLVEHTSSTPLGSGDERSDKQETKVADRPVSPKIPENIAPQLAQKGAVVGLVEHITVKKESGCNIKSELLNTEKSKLPSMLKEPVISALTAQNNHGSCGKQQFTDPCSLNLTLVKADTDAKSKTTVCESTVGGNFPPANRSLWDLNTTMDRWEDSMNEPSTSRRFHGPNGSDGAATCATTPVISSTVMVFREPERTSIHIGKEFLDKNEGKSRSHGFTNLHDRQTISDELNLCLTPSGLQSRFSQEQSCMARKIDSVGVETNSKSFESSVPSGRKLNMGGSIVKSEPSDEVNKLGFGAANAFSGRSESRGVKAEQVEDQSQECLKSDIKLISHATVKPEPIYKDNQVTFKTIEEIQSQEEQTTCTPDLPKMQDLETPAGRVETFGSMGLSHPLDSHLPTMDIPKIAEVPCQLDLHSTKVTPVNGDVVLEPCGSYGGPDSVMASESVGHDAKETEIGVTTVATSETRDLGDGNPESSRSKLGHELQNHEVAETESDEEKINISTGMLEDDSYDTGYESDGSHPMGVTSVEGKQRRVEDDFEDGEVREPLLHKGGVCKQKEQNIGFDESEYRDAGMPDHLVSKSPGENRVPKIGENVDSKDDFCGGEFSNSLPYEMNDQDAGRLATIQEPLGVEGPSTESDKKVTISATRSKSLNCSGGDNSSRGHEEDLTSNHTLCDSQVTTPGDGQSDIISQQDDVKADPGENNHLFLPMAEPSTDGDEATKDANDRFTRRRIISLPRASSGSSSSSKPRPIPGRLPSLAEKEIYTDVVFKGDRLQNQGNRDESYIDGGRKFEKERNQDHAVVDSGSEFLQGRGRVDNRLETVHDDWDPDHDFSSEHYNGPAALRLPRSKNAVSAAKLECSGFIVASDGTLVGPGRGGRKPLNDDLPVFCQPLSRRRSPVGREGPGTHVVRRPTRDMSPNRCAGGLRHEEKFMRGMPEDILEPVFSHSQPQYERVDQFMMGGRTFLPGHRRVPPRVPRIRSKSPPRSRSPGPWVSPRRSPDGFDGHQPMSRRRSPPVYRMDRIRSPHQRPCFPSDMVGRRHGSPPYVPRLPNEIREMGSREHEHPRPFLSNRSPSGRGLPRNNRRFDMIDPRERTENDEYFGGPMRSSRFHELGSEGVDERRKCNERRGPARSFRPPYNSNHVENFRFHFEDGPRPNQLCPETDPEFHERGNFRGREFDRRLKFRPGNMHRRTRSIEEQEENYRNGGHGWNDAGFDDVARGKRRRF